MRRLALFFLLLIGCLSTSCKTVQMLDPQTDSKLSIADQLTQAGFEEVSISYPSSFYDGQDWCKALKQMVESAEDYIIYTVFLGSECDENQELLDAFRKKAEEGVDIYLVVDGTGCFDLTESRFHLRPLFNLRDSGIHFLEYKPFSGTRLINLKNVLVRDHRKFLVIDGNTVALGGMNLNYISLNAVEDGGQRDSMYSFKSAQLGEILIRDFVDFWNKESFDEISVEDFALKEKTEEENIKAWFCNQYNQNFNQARMLGILLNGAKQSIRCLPFLPYCDKNMQSTMKAVKDRGVDFKMIVPFDRREDQKRAMQYMLVDLVKTGIDIQMEKQNLEDVPLLHEKLLIVDSLYVGIGSTNFNYRSMNLSNEVMLVIENPEFADQVNEHFNTLLDNTYKISQEEAEQMRKLKNLPKFVFGFFGG